MRRLRLVLDSDMINGIVSQEQPVGVVKISRSAIGLHGKLALGEKHRKEIIKEIKGTARGDWRGETRPASHPAKAGLW